MFYIARRLMWIVVTALIYSAIFHHGGGIARLWHAAGSGIDSMAAEAHAGTRPPDDASARIAEPNSVSVGFSPGNAEPLVIQTINEARHSIDVAAYSFTSAPIAQAMARAEHRGVTVRVVLDKAQSEEPYSSARYLASEGVAVRANGRFALMHDKFLVVDGQTVETGSFNYTRSAQVRNAENVIVLHAAPAMARAYHNEWNGLWAEGSPLPANPVRDAR